MSRFRLVSQRFFISLSLFGWVPVEQPPSQMCLELCYRQSYNLSSVLKQEINSSWAKEQNVMSCYQADDLGLP